MKIGIIVYSQTGNTITAAQQLQQKLKAQGHTNTLEQITVTGNASPESKDFRLEYIPAIDAYDALIFGAPVHAFSLAKAMDVYLNQLPSLEKKDAALFVTKQLRFAWTGGNRAIGRMKKICETKGAKVLGSEIIIWPKAKENLEHIEGVERLTALFTPD